jgi:hypothetical protein
LVKRSPQSREGLKAAIRALLLYDPEVKSMFERGEKLDEVRKLLKKKTEGIVV